MIIIYNFNDEDYEFYVSNEWFQVYVNSISRYDRIEIARIAHENLSTTTQVDENSLATMGDDELVDFIMQCDIQIFEDIARSYFYDYALDDYIDSIDNAEHRLCDCISNPMEYKNK